MTKKEIEEKAIKTCTCHLCAHCEAKENCEEDNEEKCEEFVGMVNGYILACEEIMYSPEQENSELKKEDKEQLTKAIETIRKLLHALENGNSDYTFALKSTHPVLTEAKQFLEENK